MRLQICLLISLLCACTLSPSAASTPTPIPPPTATAEPGWTEIRPGLAQRTYQPEGALFGQVMVLRIDPAAYTFRAHYRSGAPLTAEGWRAELPAAVAFVNANFFSVDHTVLGLLVSDGVRHGTAYTDRGGTFLVQNGQPALRSNIRQPYQGEPLEQAVQGFPMLVLDGAAAFADAGRSTRRTVVAQDRSGRILLMVTPLVGLSLVQMSAFLAESDMDIITAINLDGGGSSLMYYAPDPGEHFLLPSLDAVPAVLAVYANPNL